MQSGENELPQNLQWGSGNFDKTKVAKRLQGVEYASDAFRFVRPPDLDKVNRDFLRATETEKISNEIPIGPYTVVIGKDPGNKHPTNCDNVFVGQITAPDSSLQTLIVVTDGAGHRPGAFEASQEVSQNFGRLYTQALLGKKTPAEALVTAVDESHKLLMSAFAENRAAWKEDDSITRFDSLNTTVTAIVLEETGAYHVVNVGNSPVFEVGPDAMTRLTRDDGLVGMMVDQGMIAPDDWYDHGARNVLLNMLGPSKEAKHDIKVKDVRQGNLPVGGQMLITTDWIQEIKRDYELTWVREHINSDTPQKYVARRLIDAAQSFPNSDNVALVLLRRMKSPAEIPISYTLPYRQGEGVVGPSSRIHNDQQISTNWYFVDIDHERNTVNLLHELDSKRMQRAEIPLALFRVLQIPPGQVKVMTSDMNESEQGWMIVSMIYEGDKHDMSAMLHRTQIMLERPDPVDPEKTETKYVLLETLAALNLQ